MVDLKSTLAFEVLSRDLADIRWTQPHSGLGFLVNVLQIFGIVPPRGSQGYLTQTKQRPPKTLQ